MVKYELCTPNKVRLLSGLSELNDMSTDDINEFISDAEADVYKMYNPIYRSKIWVDENAIKAGSLALKFVPDYIDYSVHFVGSITLNGSYVGSENYTELLDEGKLLFNGSSLFENKNGYLLGVEFIPKTYNNLANTIAAIYIVDELSLLTSNDATIARADRLRAKKDEYDKNLRPKGALFSNSGGGVQLGGKIYTIYNPFDEIKRY